MTGAEKRVHRVQKDSRPLPVVRVNRVPSDTRPLPVMERVLHVL